mmetsp:Transcript_53989/g.87372  ORF Transcript_53989/g.87372 Transcript_53989/m.87372 type:complete len:253 (+) Transcript_53989:500-1258(+)|eukprot:CAMPEP_0179443402 /NCGR_PEP_ID=MMETSP0799-20121207/26833_1 /TAXON_ID=46947 /ORGANISM="Geminigera cryophila, Strain CCMP2564" /LENGTH=252 /DNA_ID=CAMNT_0021229379 /DNA_START=500 /DNA_END=1258 /DNA_ORIENTATION=+
MAGKNPKDRAPNWPSDPRVMELVVSKTVDVLKLPEVGGNPWQSRKLTECFRIVHEHLMASREKALFYPLGEDASPLTAGQMLRQVDDALILMEAKVTVSGGILTNFISPYEAKLYELFMAYKTPRDLPPSSVRKSGPKTPKQRTPHEASIIAGLPPGRFTGQHNIDTHPKCQARPLASMPCAMCEMACNTASYTRYWCSNCKKPLHADGCFRQWHSNNPDLGETHARRQLRTNPRQKRARSDADSEHEHDED